MGEATDGWDALTVRGAALHQERRFNHSPALPPYSTVAGVSAWTPATASACLNAFERSRPPVTHESEAGPVGIGVSHLARDYFKTTLLVTSPTAHVAVTKPSRVYPRPSR
jgi:hypothetical protein